MSVLMHKKVMTYRQVKETGIMMRGLTRETEMKENVIIGAGQVIGTTGAAQEVEATEVGHVTGSHQNIAMETDRRDEVIIVIEIIVVIETVEIVETGIVTGGIGIVAIKAFP